MKTNGYENYFIQIDIFYKKKYNLFIFIVFCPHISWFSAALPPFCLKFCALRFAHVHPLLAPARSAARPVLPTAGGTTPETAEQDAAEYEQPDGLPVSKRAYAQYGRQNIIPEPHDKCAEKQYCCGNHEGDEKEKTAFHSCIVKSQSNRCVRFPADGGAAAPHNVFGKSVS